MLKDTKINTISIRENHKPVCESLTNEQSNTTSTYKGKTVNILDKDIIKQDLPGWAEFVHKEGRRAKVLIYRNRKGNDHK